MSESIETHASAASRSPERVPPVSSPRSAEASLPASDTTQDRAANYERMLAQDPKWALNEGSRHFEGKSAVFGALNKIARRLTELQVPYAIVGGMALFHHGVRRFTEDIDILVAKEDLKRIHAELSGRGYLPPHRQSKHLRDVELGVRIAFLAAGEYPGDGKQKPVAFPEPAAVSDMSDGISYVNLPTLIELKLASGLTNAGRLRDLADVLELIRLVQLPAEFAQQLNPYFREKYAELWKEARKRCIARWRQAWPTANARSVEEIIRSLRAAADRLEAMLEDGVTLDVEAGADGLLLLATTDPQVARKYDMVEESEFWEDATDDE